MHSVAETSVFSRRADDLLSREERAELISTLAHDPLAEDVIPGAGGVRKLRFGGDGRGKRGGFRVIYYVLNDDMPVVAIMLYGKSQQSDLTQAEKLGAMKIVLNMKAELALQKVG